MVEILLVIALIGILASIFVINFDTLIRQNESDSLEQAFWKASSEARNLAMFERRAQDLRYDPESQAYLIGAGENVRRYTVDTSSWSDDAQVEVLFKQRLSDDSYRLIGGKLITLREAPIVRFFPDGTCMPFILEIRVGDNLRSIEVDPWSGAELLASEDER
jgi:general secretion pathway protein H